MAATFAVYAPAVTHEAGRSMVDVFNAAGSTRVVRVYLLYMFNRIFGSSNDQNYNQGTFAIRQTQSSSHGTSLTPMAFDTANTLSGSVTAGKSRFSSAYSDGIIRRFIFGPERLDNAGAGAAIGITAHFSMCMLVPWVEWGRYGLDNNTEPIVCRAGQGADIANISPWNGWEWNIVYPTSDFEIIFTDSSS